MYISGLTKSESLSFERSIKNTKCNIKGTTLDKREFAVNIYIYKFSNFKINYI